MKKIYVQCKLMIQIEVPEEEGYDMYFDIEENHCPGTGIVGIAIDKVMKESEEKGVCWACALQGQNEIL